MSRVRLENNFITIKECHTEYNYTVEWLCNLLNINRSSYYKWLKRKPSKRQLENEQLAERTTDMYNKHNGIFGTKMMKNTYQQRV